MTDCIRRRYSHIAAAMILAGTVCAMPQHAHAGKGAKKWIIGGVAAVAVGGIGVSSYSGTYNRVNAEHIAVLSQRSEVGNAERQRSDTLQNMANMVNRYAQHENSTLSNVANAIGNMRAAAQVGGASSDRQISTLMPMMLQMQAQFPDLKAAQQFSGLTDELKERNGRVAVERSRYADAVKAYQTDKSSFWTSVLVGSKFPNENFFQADQSEEHAPTITMPNQ
jgi:LemA protein